MAEQNKDLGSAIFGTSLSIVLVAQQRRRLLRSAISVFLVEDFGFMRNLPDTIHSVSEAVSKGLFRTLKIICAFK